MTTINPFQSHSTVVVGNGEYPTALAPLQAIAQASFIACCDGAADSFIARNDRCPNLIIGDGDSISPATRQLYANCFVHVAEQETNDQTKAVRFLLSAGHKDITIVGATGAREDHTLGNISLLVDYMEQGATVNMFTNTGVFFPVNKGAFINVPVGSTISFFNFSCRRLTARGVEYPTRAFTNWWQGTLNRTTAPMVEIAADGAFIVFVAY